MTRGIALSAGVKPYCRGVGCLMPTPLDRMLVDREDGSGLHVGCSDWVEPAKSKVRTEAEALELLRDKLGAEPIDTVDLPEPELANVCQVAGTFLNTACAHRESGGYLCERIDPHTDGHAFGEHTIQHARMGNGYACSAIDPPLTVKGPCRDAWCKDKPNPCGFDVAAHIAAHGPRILIEGAPAKPEPKDFREQFVAPSPPLICGVCGEPIPVAETAFYPPNATASHGRCGEIKPDPAPALSTALLDAAKAAPALFSAPAGAHPLKAEMIKIIRWYDSSRPRSLQREIGMSEVGVECLRRLAYSALETPPVNTSRDPWFAIIGTSVHAWLADALTAWNGAPGNDGPAFQVEQRVTASDGTIVVPGSTDFYRNAKVGDHKIVGPDALKRTRDNGPSAQYVTQVQVNGLAWEQAGWPVDEVALLLYPRSGYLDGMHVWSQPYNRQVALDALARLSSVKATAAVLGPAALPATADRGCVFCPFWRAGNDADSTGCPGK